MLYHLRTSQFTGYGCPCEALTGGKHLVGVRDINVLLFAFFSFTYEWIML
jgi:hypothetical protein